MKHPGGEGGDEDEGGSVFLPVFVGDHEGPADDLDEGVED